MIYDTLIILLGLSSIVGILYFSNKVSRSPVRHIGMVRSARMRKPSADSATANKFDAEDNVIWSAVYNIQPFEQDIAEAIRKSFQKGRINQEWECGQCGLVQGRQKDLSCSRCGFKYEELEKARPKEAPQSSVQDQLRAHSRTFETQDDRIASLERKIKKIESDALRGVQEPQFEPTPEAYRIN